MSRSKSKKSQAYFRDIGDAISVGALLRPTIVRAVDELSFTQRELLFKLLEQTEKSFARSERTPEKRFAEVKLNLERTFVLGPIWRFISGRIEDTWREVKAPGVKELATVTLLLGMLYEETETQLNLLGKKRSA